MKQIKETLRAICQDLYLITGIKAGVYDVNFQPIYAHPHTMGPFCQAIRRDGGMLRKCMDCDRRGFEACRASGDMAIYRCHMGLTEAIAPIQENGVLSGYLMFGQLLSAGDKPQVLSRLVGLENGDFLRREVEKMPETDEHKIRAAARLAVMCACYIRLLDILGPQRERLDVQVRQYIGHHLGDPGLSIAQVCAAFGISRSTLYHLSSRAFAMGITQFIREQRLMRAQEWIASTDLSVGEIAERCGFADADYMTRLIRQRTGKTPRALRKAGRT